MQKIIYMLIVIVCSCSSVAGDDLWQSIYNFFLPSQAPLKVLFEAETDYFTVNVIEDESKKRHLVFLPLHGSQSIWDPQQPEKIISPSIKTLCATLAVSDTKPKQYLFLGMGAGIMPRFINRYFPEAEIDIVELDPQIPVIAKQYFGFKSNKKIKIITSDARVYINRCKKRYDIIIVDVYNAKAVPFAVTTQEFFSRLKECLKPHGAAGVNLANLGNNKFLASELFTISQVFNNIVIYACPGDSNFIPIFSPNVQLTPKKLSMRLSELDKKYKFSFSLSEWLDECSIVKNCNNYFDMKPVFITDDFAF